ncbi:hypothetical protein RM69_00440, partial [Mesotoga sp. SC_NapDC3]
MILQSLEKREIRELKTEGMFAMKRFLMCVLLLASLTSASIGCTGFRVVSKDGSIIAARTLEFE